MKKSIILGIGVVVIGVLAFLATNLVRNSGKSDTELLEFAIADTASIDKIIVNDAYGNRIELLKKSPTEWVDGAGNCIIQEPVQTMLETFKNIEFKGYVPENSRKTITNRMAATSIKVEIFSNGKWAKTWYIGNSTQDHYGTYMLLETPKEKSDLPVIMKVRGLNGIIEPRFFADARRWKCTQIFKLEKEDISSIDVKYNDIPERSFSVGRSGNQYVVKHNGRTLQDADTNMVLRYMSAYRKVHFEMVNYDLDDKQVDSLKRSTPFCVLTVKKTNGETEKLKLYRVEGTRGVVEDDYGIEVEYDVDRLWCVLPNGDLVKCQYFVFNPMIMGHIYFRFDDKPSEYEKDLKRMSVHRN